LLSEDLSPKVSLGSGCRASDQHASKKEISLPAALASPEQTITTRKQHTHRLLTKTNLSGPAQHTPEHQRRPATA